MTTVDRAAEIIETKIDLAEELGRPAQEAAPGAAHALDKAGLLAPDAPGDRPIGVRVIGTRAVAAIDLDRATVEDLTGLVSVLMDIKINGAADFYAAHAANDRWDLPVHRTEAGYPNCSTCDGGGCPDCTDPA